MFVYRCAAPRNLAQKLGSRLTSSALAMKMAATAMATRRWIDRCVFSLETCSWASNAYSIIALPRVLSLFNFSEVRGLLAACLWVQAGSQG